MGLTGGTPRHLLYIDGKPRQKLEKEDFIDQLESEIRATIQSKSRNQVQGENDTRPINDPDSNNDLAGENIIVRV